MLKIPVKHGNRNTQLIILNRKFYIEDSKVTYQEFINIRSLHVKNTNVFLIKIRLDPADPIIIEFENMNLRDLTKAILYSKITSPEDLQKAVLEKSDEAQNIFETVNKSSSGDFIRSKLWNQIYAFNRGICVQQQFNDIYSPIFVSAITQPIIELFISLNCPINQFYNLFVNSYFYDIKNEKTSLDRLITERLRGFSSDINYASRINSYGILTAGELGNAAGESKKTNKKVVNYEPNLLFNENNKQKVREGDSCEIKINKLTCDFAPKIIPAKILFNCDIKELKTARDMCRLVQMNDTAFVEDALKFSDELKQLIEKEYGEDGLVYLERLFPRFYFKKQ